MEFKKIIINFLLENCILWKTLGLLILNLQKFVKSFICPKKNVVYIVIICTLYLYVASD